MDIQETIRVKSDPKYNSSRNAGCSNPGTEDDEASTTVSSKGLQRSIIGLSSISSIVYLFTSYGLHNYLIYLLESIGKVLRALGIS